MGTSPASIFPSASLDPLETDEQAAQREDQQARHYVHRRELDFRHSGSRSLRSRITRVLERSTIHPDAMKRWANCGLCATVEQDQNDDRKFRIVSYKCHHRFCPACAGERSRRIARNVAARIGDEPHRMITLTIKHKNEDLQFLTNKLLKSFKALRRTPVWRTSVRGGIAFLEIKCSNGWHPHLHMITVGNRVDHRELVREWERITGDSRIVHISFCRVPKTTVNYVAKYASKPLDGTVTRDEARLEEALKGLAGRKLVFTFGSWRGWRVYEDKEAVAWITIGPLIELIDRANRGEVDAVQIVERLFGQKRRGDLWSEERSPPTDGQQFSPLQRDHSVLDAGNHLIRSPGSQVVNGQSVTTVEELSNPAISTEFSDSTDLDSLAYSTINTASDFLFPSTRGFADVVRTT